MQIDRLDAHDRHKTFTNQDFSISECIEDLIKKEPFGNRTFYIFAHARTDDDGLKKRLIWQPRLTKPKAQTNSMLFKVHPNSEHVEVLWILPSREMWPQYETGKVCESNIVLKSIDAFETRRNELDAEDPSDPSDDEIRSIYRTIIHQKQHETLMDLLWLPKQAT